MAFCLLSYSCLHSHSSPVFHSYWFLSFPAFCLCRLCEIKQLTSSRLRAINHCRCLTIRRDWWKTMGLGGQASEKWERDWGESCGGPVLAFGECVCVCWIGILGKGEREWEKYPKTWNKWILTELVNCLDFISTIQCRHFIKRQQPISWSFVKPFHQPAS